MSNRIRQTFARRAESGSTALVIYLTFGDPTPVDSVAIVRAAIDAGADVIELGVPFSDPSADGVVIQHAMQRALAQGASMRGALDAVRTLRRDGAETPVVLFGYYNPLVTYGLPSFARDAREAGVDALLTVDVPMDELDEVHGPVAEQGLGVVPLVAPTTGEDRIAAVRAFEPPFVYYISMAGVTGGHVGAVADGPARVAAVRQAAGAPVAVGFGIRSPDDAREVAEYADGVVVGSAAIRAVADGDAAGAPARVRDYVASLRAVL